MGEREKSGNIVEKFFLIALLIAVIGLVVICALQYKKHQTLQNEYQNIQKEYKKLSDSVDGEVQDRLNEKIEQVKQEEYQNTLNLFRENMSVEGNIVSFLRKTYGDKYLVYAGNSKYIYRPILDIKMADYSKGQFVTDETTGLKSFQVDGKSVTKHVIDVSKYQNTINWKSVKNAGIEGAMIRAGVRGYGSGEIVADTMFDKNMSGALKAGLDVGAYFFSEAVTVEEAKEEAKFLIDALKPYKVNLPVVMDLELIDNDVARNESVSKEDLTQIAIAFLEEIKNAGYEPMLYGNIYTIYDMVDMTKLSDYKLWFAYYSDDIYIPYKVDMWQYASDGKIDGVPTDCDVNVMFVE